MIPLLIVGFAREQNIVQMINEYSLTQRRIYLFVDKADWAFKAENAKLIEYATSLDKGLNIKIKISDQNLGVGRAVPTAINWVFESEKAAIILEDDCYLTASHLTYFDKTISFLSEDKVMVCGTAPDFGNSSLIVNEIVPIRYPLIWGWATDSDSWNNLRNSYNWSILTAFREISLKFELQYFFSIAFFLAALIRVRRGRVSSWDAEIAFVMLTKNYKSLVPNRSIVSNRGADEYAHHTLDSEQISYSQTPVKDMKVSNRIDINDDKIEIKRIEKLIEKNIYNLKKRHLLSPVKALFGY
jgi:hypothetical protein